MKHQWSGSWACSLILTVLALISCAAPQRAASQALRSEVGAYELEVLVDGSPARTFMHAGETHILGQEGRRYILRVHNRSGRRIEAVVSVDGLDVIDGKSGDFANKRGYLVPAHDFVDIDGWRLSNREAAAFRFSPIAESYAAKTGTARNVGVIGVAVFPERIVRVSRPVQAPHDDYYGAPRTQSSDDRSPYFEPSYESESRGLGRRAEVQQENAAPSRSAAPAPAPAAETSAGAASHGAPAARMSADAEPAKKMRSRSGLGTEFGEAVSSEIRQVEFVRAHAARPAAFLGARYNDRDGLYALGIDVDGVNPPSDLALRQSADPFPSARGFARPPADWRRN
ncbi:MAG: hypothetical protein JWN04_4377 [Myxococcaceae bacterium]|nr:hypothetical protein [Myxococcaceae bacterium]